MNIIFASRPLWPKGGSWPNKIKIRFLNFTVFHSKCLSNWDFELYQVLYSLINTSSSFEFSIRYKVMVMHRLRHVFRKKKYTYDAYVSCYGKCCLLSVTTLEHVTSHPLLWYYWYLWSRSRAKANGGLNQTDRLFHRSPQRSRSCCWKLVYFYHLATLSKSKTSICSAERNQKCQCNIVYPKMTLKVSEFQIALPTVSCI